MYFWYGCIDQEDVYITHPDTYIYIIIIYNNFKHETTCIYIPTQYKGH